MSHPLGLLIRLIKRSLSVVLATWFGLSLQMVPAMAAAPADPWADAVYNFSGTGVDNPNNALGPPDGQTTNAFGLQKFITLDMGAGEEGTGSLRAYFGQLLIQSDIQVVFLDASLNPISSDSRTLTISTSTRTEVFNYQPAEAGQAYRYVRMLSLAEVGFTLDAVEALSYNKPPTPPAPPTPPPAGCETDTWSCEEWSVCSSSGRESRTCRMTSDCPGVATPSPALTRECIPPSSSPSTPASSYYYYYSNTTQAPAPSAAPAPSTAPAPAPSAAPARPRGSSGSASASADVNPPVISNVQATPLDHTTEKISWTSDEACDSGVEYGAEGGVQRFTPPDLTLTKEHTVWLSGLNPGTTYTFRVYCHDAAGNQARSPESQFTTLGGLVSSTIIRLGMCGWFNVLLAILLILMTILAAHWHGQVKQLQKRAVKKM